MAVKIPFFSRLDLPSSEPTCSGNRFRIDFVDSFDDKGVALVKPKGQTDFQDFINSFFNDVDLYTILSRVLPNVNARDLDSITINELLSTYFSNFKEHTGQFIDITDLPKNCHEVNKSYIAMCEYFNKLPAEVRLKYDNSVDQFVAGFDGFTKDLAKALDDSLKIVESEPVKEGDNNV